MSRRIKVETSGVNNDGTSIETSRPFKIIFDFDAEAYEQVSQLFGTAEFYDANNVGSKRIIFDDSARFSTPDCVLYLQKPDGEKRPKLQIDFKNMKVLDGIFQKLKNADFEIEGEKVARENAKEVFSLTEKLLSVGKNKGQQIT